MEQLRQQNLLSNQYKLADEYMLVLNLTSKLNIQVQRIKRDFYQKYGNYLGRYSQPHIALSNFFLTPGQEPKLVSELDKFMDNQPPFPVELRNYGRYERSNTIYINVSTKDSLKAFNKGLWSMLIINQVNKKRLKYCSDPHLSIGRKLTDEQMEQAWSSLAQTKFQGLFLAESIVLLKRKDFFRWDICKKYLLG